MPVGAKTIIAGRFQVVDRLGSGGMGSVMLAEDQRLGRRVAIKRLHAARTEGLTERFRREALIGASLRHPNLTTVFDVLEHEGDVLLVMEYVEGQTLGQALRAGPLGAARGQAVLREVAAVARSPRRTSGAR